MRELLSFRSLLDSSYPGKEPNPKHGRDCLFLSLACGRDLRSWKMVPRSRPYCFCGVAVLRNITSSAGAEEGRPESTPPIPLAFAGACARQSPDLPAPRKVRRSP